MPTATTSPYRIESRAIIAKVIADNVFGHPQCLPHGDVLLLRRKLREAYPYHERKYWPYRVWCEEVRHALGYPVKRPTRKPRHKKMSRQKIMPSMLAWAEARGLVDPRVE